MAHDRISFYMSCVSIVVMPKLLLMMVMIIANTY